MNSKNIEFSLEKRKISSLFKNDNKNIKEYEIPLYQRAYKWGIEQINSLLDDIKQRTKDGNHHFFGIIAISAHRKVIGDILYRRIIDGQQRIVTSILIIDTVLKKIENKKLQYKYKNFAEMFPNIKFQNEINTDDSEVIQQIINNEINNNKIKSTKIPENIEIIKNYIKEKMKSIDLIAFLNTFLDCFYICELEYDINKKDEMLAFENLNSKGSPLSEYDLIKNLIISIGDKENPKSNLKLFMKKIENNLKVGKYELKNSRNKEKMIEDFFSKYIIFKTNKDLMSFQTYRIYKNLKIILMNEIKKNNFLDTLNEIEKYFILYLEIIPNSKFKNKDEKRIYYNPWFSSLKKDIHFSYVFALFKKYSYYDAHNKKWNDNKEIEYFIKKWTQYVIKLITIYGTGQSLLSEIISLTKLLSKDEDDKKLLEEKVKVWEENKNISKKNFLDKLNDRSQDDWINKSLINIIEYECFQRGNSKIIYGKRTLEHIYPKKPKWFKDETKNTEDAISQHKKHLNLIGNYCLIDKSINISLSNSSFWIKKEKHYLKIASPLLKDSNILGVNIKPVIDYNEWTYESIKERTKSLIKIIDKIFI